MELDVSCSCSLESDVLLLKNIQEINDNIKFSQGIV